MPIKDIEAKRLNKRNYYLRRKEENPTLFILKEARRRARNKGLAFSLTSEDIIIPKTCPVLGIHLNFGTDHVTPNSPTLDRVDNTKGYTKDNVCIISYRANRIKTDATEQELQLILEYIRGSRI